MSRFEMRSGWAAATLAALDSSTPTAVRGAANMRGISARADSSGSAKPTLTGPFQASQNIAINKQASFNGGDMTWIQFGASASEASNSPWP